MTRPAAEGSALALAGLIGRAASLVRTVGWVPVVAEGRPGVTLSLALCRTAMCEVLRPGLPIYHTDECRMAHARVVGWLYLEGLAGDAEVRVPEALGEWERFGRPGADLVAFVAAATAGHIGLSAAIAEAADTKGRLSSEVP